MTGMQSSRRDITRPAQSAVQSTSFMLHHHSSRGVKAEGSASFLHFNPVGTTRRPAGESEVYPQCTLPRFLQRSVRMMSR